MPPNYVPEEEINREAKRGSKSKRDSVRVVPPSHSLLPLLRPIYFINIGPFLATTLLLHLARSIYG